MLLNLDTKIAGQRVVLVPYRTKHVSKYHGWMQSPELLRLTASEPLTLEAEYRMQRSWMNDSNKCTFIVLDREKYECTGDEIESMIGDTNLFISDPDDKYVAEAEIMIAEEWARGRRCGVEAISLMLWYGMKYLNIKRYIVRILFDNEISMKLFQKLGFVETCRSITFKEVTLEKDVDESFTDVLKSICNCIEVSEHKLEGDEHDNICTIDK